MRSTSASPSSRFATLEMVLNSLRTTSAILAAYLATRLAACIATTGAAAPPVTRSSESPAHEPADHIGDQDPHELPHRRHELAHDRDHRAHTAAHPRRTTQRVDHFSGTRPIRITSGTSPTGRAITRRGLQVTGRPLDAFADFLPGPYVGADDRRCPGQVVQRVLQRLNVLDQPPDPVGRQRAHRIHVDTERFKPGTDDSQARLDPIPVVDPIQSGPPRLQQADPGDRRGVVLRFRDERVVHPRPNLSNRSTLSDSTCS